EGLKLCAVNRLQTKREELERVSPLPTILPPASVCGVVEIHGWLWRELTPGESSPYLPTELEFLSPRPCPQCRVCQLRPGSKTVCHQSRARAQLCDFPATCALRSC